MEARLEFFEELIGGLIQFGKTFLPLGAVLDLVRRGDAIGVSFFQLSGASLLVVKDGHCGVLLGRRQFIIGGELSDILLPKISRRRSGEPWLDGSAIFLG